MYMAINIKNPETTALVAELAKLTNDTLTGAITVAVREKRDRVLESHDGRLEQMRAIATLAAAQIPEGVTSAELFDDLYDENGLPR